ncbi:MAG TPA: 50S ribosomal protein L9 [Polyangiaceae bacterium]|jgi:large subunit ribosomal protein L9
MATAIKVLLQSDVDGLGSGGQVVRVRPGYARNFLLPRGLALPATAGNLARVDDLKKRAATLKQKDLEVAQELAKKVEGVSVKIARSVGEEGKMYGSVTAKDIGDAYEAAGVAIDRKKIQLAEPLRALGSVEVPLKLHSSLSVTLKIEVVKK